MEESTTSHAPWSKEQIEQKVRELTAAEAHVSVEKVQIQTRPIEDLNFDSLMEIELLMKLEDAFDINLPDPQPGSDVKMPKSVGEFADIVRAKLQEESTGD
jgi:acyl carrier protein